jgi:uncharacterized membrane protein
MNNNVAKSINTNATKFLLNVCPPVKIYAVFMLAVILFDFYLHAYKHAFVNFVFLLLGSFFLWVLCSANLDFVGYGLLILPVLFFVFLFALILYDQTLLSVRHQYLKDLHEYKKQFACKGHDHTPHCTCGCDQ